MIIHRIAIVSTVLLNCLSCFSQDLSKDPAGSKTILLKTAEPVNFDSEYREILKNLDRLKKRIQSGDTNYESLGRYVRTVAVTIEKLKNLDPALVSEGESGAKKFKVRVAGRIELKTTPKKTERVIELNKKELQLEVTHLVPELDAMKFKTRTLRFANKEQLVQLFDDVSKSVSKLERVLDSAFQEQEILDMVYSIELRFEEVEKATRGCLEKKNIKK